MQNDELKKIKAREKEVISLAHSIAKQVVDEGVTYSEAFFILEDARDLIKQNMVKQRAAIQSKKKDCL